MPVNYLAELKSTGGVDDTFSPGRGIDNIVYGIIQDSNGKLIISGSFQNINGKGQSGVARLEPDGALDTTFVANLSRSFVRTAGFQSNQKLILGGVLMVTGTTNIQRLVRLNADGSLDPSFNPGTGPNGRIQQLLVQPDDKIIITGDFTRFNGVVCNRIGRLQSNGTLDSSFNSGAGPNDNINAMALQSDGKLIVVGDFTLYNQLIRNRIARLDQAGSLDAAFNSQAGANLSIATVTTGAQGKIFLGGDFTLVNGTNRARVARLQSNGLLDLSFSAGTGPDNHVGELQVQADGKLLIGGFFSSVAGASRNRIARLNADGSLDPRFDVGIGADNTVYSICLQGDNKILIGGSFQNVNGISRSFLARLYNDPLPLLLDIKSQVSGSDLVLNIRGAPGAPVLLQSSPDLALWTVLLTNVLSVSGTLSITQSIAGSVPKQFYRCAYR
jgi:uncharacterized delta-60 repeat protein